MQFIQPYHHQKRNTLTAAVTYNNSELTFLVLSCFIKCRTAVDAGIPSNHGQGKVGMCEVVHDSKPQISKVSSGSVGTCRAFQTDHQVCVNKRICIMIYPNQNGSQATCHDRVSDTFNIALPPAMNSWSIVSAILVASAALPISFSQSSHGKQRNFPGATLLTCIDSSIESDGI